MIGHSPRTTPPALRITLSFVLCIAFALRVAGITHQSIWYDEGLSIFYAHSSLVDLVTGTAASEHPPLFPLLLKAWMALLGDSELSVRLLSAWWGVLAVALLYRLGRRLSLAHGALAALLLAFSPLAIWLSQETRGYTMALALTTSTVDVAYGLWHGHRDPHNRVYHRRWVPYLLYVVLAAAALYTHLYSAFVLVAVNTAWAAHQVIAGRQKGESGRLMLWVGAQLAVLALFVPWLPHISTQWQLNATYYHGAVDWKQVIRRTLIAFGVGKTLDGPWAIGATWALSLLAGLGTVTIARHRRDRLPLLLLWLWILVPIVFQIALNRNLPKYAPRYLLNALPPFLLLASAGFLWLLEHAQTVRARTVRSRTVRVREQVRLASLGWLATLTLLSLTALIGGATTRSLANHYLDKSLYRPDVRGVARYIKEHATDQDLIVLVGGHNFPAFAYYYRGALPILPLPEGLLPNTRAPVDVRALATLDRAISGRQQLWLVLWQEYLADPTGLVVDELEHTYHRLGVGQTFHDVGLLTFDVSPGPLLAQNATPSSPMHTDFGDQIRLLGYDLPKAAVQPGGTLYLYIYWESLGQIDHDYKVFTQVLDKGQNIVAQHDKSAGAESYPTSHWPAGALVRDRFMLTFDPDAPPGQHTLIAGLYRPGRNTPRLSVSGQGGRGDHVVLAEIEIKGD